jgi:hypothetical protein
MAKILRFQEPLRFEPVSYRGLDTIPVFIQDDSPISYDYFGITQAPTELTAGRNMLSFTGTKNLVPGAEIAIEVLDANGNIIPVRTYDHIGEGNERVFSIEVNEDTPEGDALITLVSVAKGKVAFDRERQRDLSERVPRGYVNRFNIRWQKRLNCYPRRRNVDAIQFFPNPDITIEEVKKPYFELVYNQRLIKFGTAHASASIYFDNNFGPQDEVRIQVDSSGSAWRFIASDPNNTPEDHFPIIFWPTASTTASSVERLAQEIENSPLQISTSYTQIGGVDYIHMTASYAGDEANQWKVFTGSHYVPNAFPASASFNFETSASAGSYIGLTSDDGTSVIYWATESGTNGDVTADGTIWLTGSSAATAATNLSASIAHSNGHGGKIAVEINAPVNGAVSLSMFSPAANNASHADGNTAIDSGSNGTVALGLAQFNNTWTYGLPASFSGGAQSESVFTQSLAQQFQGGAYQLISGAENDRASYTLCSKRKVGGYQEQTGSHIGTMTPISGAYDMGVIANTSTKLRYEVEGDKYFVYVAGDVGADFGGFTEDMVGGTLLFPEPNNPFPSSYEDPLAPPLYNTKEDGDGHAFYSQSHGTASVFLQGAYDTIIMERISPFQVRVNSPHTTMQGITRAQQREVFHQKFDESDFRLDWAQEPISHSNSMNQVYRQEGKEFLTSYAKINFNNLTPLVGDITRIKTYMRNDQTVNDFIMMGDNPVYAQELLIQSQSLVERKPAGDFSKFGFSNYDELYLSWEILGPPSSSNLDYIMDSPELALYNMQTVALNNPIKESLQIGDGVYANTVYNMDGDTKYARLFSKVPIELRKDQYYQVEFNAYAININNAFGSPNCEVYMDGPAVRAHGDEHGKKIGEIKDIENRELIVETDYRRERVFKPIKFTFKADATEYAYLLLKINRGLWYFSDISVKPYSQFGHTPHTFEVILPTQKADVRKMDAIDFRFEFYNDDHKKAVYVSEIHNVEFENVYSLIATNAFIQNAEIKNFIGETPLGDNDWAYAGIGNVYTGQDGFDNPGAGVTYQPSITGSIFHHGRVGIGAFYKTTVGTGFPYNPIGPNQGFPLLDGATSPAPANPSPVQADLHVMKIQSTSGEYIQQGEAHNPFGGGSAQGKHATVRIQNIGEGGKSILTLDSDSSEDSGSSLIQFLSRGGGPTGAAVSESIIGSTNIPNTDPHGHAMDGASAGSFIIHDINGDMMSFGVRGNARFHIASGLSGTYPDSGSNVVLIGHRNPNLGGLTADHRLDISGSQIIRSGTLWLPDAYIYPNTSVNTDPPYILGTDSTHSVVKIPHAELCMDDDWYISSTYISQSRTGSYGKMVGIFDAPYGTTQQGTPQDPLVNSLIFNISQSGLVSKVRFEGIPQGVPTQFIGIDSQGMLYTTGSDFFSIDKHIWHDLRDDYRAQVTMSHDTAISGTLFISASERADDANLKVLVRNPVDGRVYYTGSYGVGGTGGGTSTIDQDWFQVYATESAPDNYTSSMQTSGSVRVGYDVGQLIDASSPDTPAYNIVHSNASPRSGETMPALVVKGRIEQDLCNGNFHNVAIGVDAMVSASHGPGGANGLGLNVTGMHYNVAVGSFAARAANEKSSGGIYIGHYAGPQPDSVGGGKMTTLTLRNIVIGRTAGVKMNGADDNVIIGYLGGSSIAAGSYNVTIGNNAGSGITSGDRNILIGYNTGDDITTGDGNIIIGAYAGTGNYSDQLIIGNGSFSATTAPIGAIGISGNAAQILLKQTVGINCTPDYPLDIVCTDTADLATDPVRVRNFQSKGGYVMAWDPSTGLVHHGTQWIHPGGPIHVDALHTKQHSPGMQFMSGSIGVVPGTATTNSAGTFPTESYTTEMTYDRNDETSFVITGSLGAKMYFSGSGKIGVGTTDPKSDFDLRSQNIEGTGSILDLAYHKTTKEALQDTDNPEEQVPQVGDVIGAVRFRQITGSLGEDAQIVGGIFGVVNGVNSDGVQGDIVFKVTPGYAEPAVEVMKIVGDATNLAVSMSHPLVGTSGEFSTTLNVASHIYANGNIIGDGSTNISGINSITADRLNVTTLTSSIISSSISYQSGSNIFGTEDTDVQLFYGHISASGDISGSSLTVNGDISSSTGDIYGKNLYGAEAVYHDQDANTGIIFTSDTVTVKNNNATTLKLATTNGSVVGNSSYHLGISGSQIFAGSHITASGDISASGTMYANIFSAGNVNTKYINTHPGGDAIVQIEETGIDVTGDITASGNTYIAGKLGVNAASPGYTLQVSGDVGVANYIYHNGDPDTYILMETDMINLVAGGKSGIKIDEDEGWIRINNTNANLDFQVNADDGEVTLHADAGTNKIGINTTTPDEALTVQGNISASGNLTTTEISASHISASGGITLGDGSTTPTTIEPLLINFNPEANGNGTTFKVDDANSKTSLGGLIEFEVSSTKIELGTSATQHVTASGNISASGDLFANELTLKGPSAGISIEADSGTEIISTGATAFNITSGGDLYLLAGSNEEVRIGSNATNDELRLNQGHVTASGNISASGTIIAATLDAAAVSDTLAAAIVAEIDNDEIPIAKLAEDAITIAGTAVTLGGSITADTIAGQISNDTISGNQINGGTIDSTTVTQLFASHVSASGDISSSGTLIAQQMRFGALGSGHVTLGASDGDIVGYETDSTTNAAYMLSNHSAGGKLSLYTGGSLYSLITYTGDSYINPSAANGFVIGGTSTTAKFEVVGNSNLTHISASGNVSSSGFVSASAINTPTLTGEGTDTILFVDGQITASSHISSSGTITAAAFVGDGSALTNLPGGGGIFAETGSGNFSTTLDSTQITGSFVVVGDTTLGTATSTHQVLSAITASSTISASGYIYAGGDIHSTGDVVASSTTPSDYRLKENIESLDNSLDKIKDLEGKSFNWKDSGEYDYGLIAQEVEKILPELVKEKNNISTGGTQKVVKYVSMIPILIESIKELDEKNEILEEKLNKLISEVNKLKNN